MANAIHLLYDMCRLCLDEPGTHDILENTKLLQNILLCTGILSVSCTDRLPRNICTTCMYRIEVAKDLRKYSFKNDSYMKSLLNDDCMKVHKIAKPIVPLGLVMPLEETLSSSAEAEDRSPKSDKQKKNVENNKESQNGEKFKISIRSLMDINSFVFRTNSSEKDESSHKKKISNSAPHRDRKAKTETHEKQKCDSSSERHKISPEKKLQRSGDGIRFIEEYKCDLCKKSYPTPRKLYMHRRSHTKTLHCPLDACGKSFATKGDLQKHIRSHTGEKPYKCDLCDKSFTQNVTLKSHKETVHVEKHE